MKRVYLAGPDVFYPDAQERGERLKALCSTFGLEGVFPLDASLNLDGLTKYGAAVRILQANTSLICSCDGILANMNPFRGPSMDVGTAYEMGFGAALGLSVAGYSSDFRLYKERVPPDGLLVEDFDMLDNLMVHGTVGTVCFFPEQALGLLADRLGAP